jgi:hypothetical protein
MAAIIKPTNTQSIVKNKINWSKKKINAMTKKVIPATIKPAIVCFFKEYLNFGRIKTKNTIAAKAMMRIIAPVTHTELSIFILGKEDDGLDEGGVGAGTAAPCNNEYVNV